MELATLQWVSWFSHHLLLPPIGYIPLAEAEANDGGISPIRSPWWRPDLNQLASTKAGAVQAASNKDYTETLSAIPQ